MKTTIIIMFSVFLNIFCYSQGLDQNIKDLADNIALKTIGKNITKIALADFVNNLENSDALTKYITDQMEMNLVNLDDQLQIMDRKHTKQLLAEHHLQSAGLIDESVAKSTISFIKVDGWLIGEIISLGEDIKIIVKIVDITTSEILAMESTGIIKDNLIKSLQQNKKELEIVNNPVQSIENPKKETNSNSECETNNTGDFCFENSTNGNINIYLSTNNGPVLNKVNSLSMSLSAKESQCFYNLKATVWSYSVWNNKIDRYNPIKNGQIKVEKCNSKKIIIK